MTFWPFVQDDNRRIMLVILGTFVLLHALLSVFCLAYFFDDPKLYFSAPLIPGYNGITLITSQ